MSRVVIRIIFAFSLFIVTPLKLYANTEDAKQQVSDSAKVAFYQKYAELGIADAQYELGLLYHKGVIVPKNINQAINWYEKAAENNHQQAAFVLGEVYCCEEGVRNYEPSRYWFIKAKQSYHSKRANQVLSKLQPIFENLENAKQGDVDAQYNLIQLFDENTAAIPKDRKNISYWCEITSLHTSSKPALIEFICNPKDEGIVRQFDSHLTNFYKNRVNLGSVDAMLQLAKLFLYYSCDYSHVDFCTANFNVALEWLTKAVLKGSVEAMYQIASLYDNAQSYGQDDDIEMAEVWYAKAAENGHANAQYRLGILLLSGDVSLLDKITGPVLIYKAAKNGHQAAEYEMGEAFIQYNKKLSVDLFYSAAQKGHFMSQFKMAQIFHKGVVKTKDYDQAFYWYTKVAQIGSEYFNYHGNMIDTEFYVDFFAGYYANLAMIEIVNLYDLELLSENHISQAKYWAEKQYFVKINN